MAFARASGSTAMKSGLTYQRSWSKARIDIVESIAALYIPGLENVRARISRFERELQSGQFEAAYDIARAVLRDSSDNPAALNSIAWTIAIAKSGDKRDLDLALEAARLANRISDGGDYGILDTLARVHFERREYDEAIEYQTAAVRLAGESRDAPGMIRALKKYREVRRER